VCGWFAGQASAEPDGGTLALVGATVVDVSGFGRSAADLHDSVILVRGATIAAVGPRGAVALPPGAHPVDVSGKFIIPGLVDGFAGINCQGQADANLFMGVTTVVGSGDDRRGRLFLTGSPSPHIYLMDSVGATDDYALFGQEPEWAAKLKGRDVDVELDWDDTSRMMDEQARKGIRALWLGWVLTASNTSRIIAKARQLGLAAYGEFIATPYPEGVRDGASTLLHMDRYSLGLITPEMQQPLAREPVGPAANKAYDFADDIPPRDPRVSAYGRLIARSRVALMPTFSLYYDRLPGHRNLWKTPVAALLDPKRVFRPTDPATGEPNYPSAAVRARREWSALQTWEQNKALAAHHPVFLAASGSPVFGSLPGISMHVEMELLVRMGLSPREALAAATSNYADTFGWRELGSVTPGRRADLVVLDRDPTADIGNTERISLVVLEGKIVNRSAMLSERAAAGSGGP
jgi:hypothetical protein